MDPRTTPDANNAAPANLTTTSLHRGTRARATLPVIVCPEDGCGHKEPGAYVGSKTGEVVVYHPDRFRDERGFYYCPKCFIVWNGLNVPYSAPTDATEFRARTMEPYMVVGVDHKFRAAEAANGTKSRWHALAQRQRAVEASFILNTPSSTSLRRAGDRMRDVEAVCGALGLTSIVREAAVYHLAAVTRGADLRSLAVRAREESFTLATVDIVAERFDVHVPLGDLLDTLRSADGARMAVSEFFRARDALAKWFHAHLW